MINEIKSPLYDEIRAVLEASELYISTSTKSEYEDGRIQSVLEFRENPARHVNKITLFGRFLPELTLTFPRFYSSSNSQPKVSLQTITAELIKNPTIGRPVEIKDDFVLFSREREGMLPEEVLVTKYFSCEIGDYLLQRSKKLFKPKNSGKRKKKL